MRKIIFLLIPSILFFITLYSTGIIVLDQEKAVDFYEKMAENNIFVKLCTDVDIDKFGHFYFLDNHYKHIFKVDKESGKLIRIISSSGQGPGELQHPQKFKIKNDKIFVSDKGYQGIKIFSIHDGKMIKEFKTYKNMDNIDVSDNNDIYVQEIDMEKNTLISVYDFNGNRKRSLIKFNPKIVKDVEQFGFTVYFHFALDNQESIIVLYYLKRKIVKYSKEGKLIWERDIRNKIIDKYPRDEKIVRTKSTISKTYYISNLDVNTKGDILVGHVSGGVLYNSHGEVEKLFRFKESDRLKNFKMFNNSIINAQYIPGNIKIYKIEL